MLLMSQPNPITFEIYTGRTVQGRQMLIARRLIERGVRMVQVWHGAGQPWDSHSQIAREHGRLAGESDQPIAALLAGFKNARFAGRNARDLGRGIWQNSNG